MVSIGALVATAMAGAGAAAGYLGLVTGALPLDVGAGRRRRPLGPQTVDIAAPRELVFDVIAQPYLGRATRAMSGSAPSPPPRTAISELRRPGSGSGRSRTTSARRPPEPSRPRPPFCPDGHRPDPPQWPGPC
ncbi:hypothetical protein ACFYO0_34465 [Streptomyces sp. NPDC006365]|uniref:hypothetical protein n=1 Tax=Streptomyces sp. NPDC006365 TaxID=3364744 RepID=UPI0036854949